MESHVSFSQSPRVEKRDNLLASKTKTPTTIKLSLCNMKALLANKQDSQTIIVLAFCCCFFLILGSAVHQVVKSR